MSCESILPWMVLFLGSFLCFAGFFVEEYPGALLSQVSEWFGGPEKYSEYDNLMLASSVSYPNIIMPLLSGFIVDKVTGLRLGLLIQVTGGLIGQVIYSNGIQFKIYWVCVLGRIVGGLMDHTYCPIVSLVAHWWAERQLSFAIGIVNAIARLGSSLSFLLLPLLVGVDVPFAFWTGSFIYLVSLLCAVYVGWIDWYHAPHMLKKLKSDDQEDWDEGVIENREIREPVSLQDIKNLKKLVWVIVCLNTFYYITYILIFTTGSITLQKTGKKYDPKTASQFLSIPPFVSIVLYPIAGIVIDKVNIHLFGALLGMGLWILGLFGFLAFMYQIYIPIEIIMVMLGIGYTIYANSIYSYIPLIVEGKILTTVYGILSSSINAGVAITLPVLAGVQVLPEVKDTQIHYVIPVIVEIVFSFFSFLFLIGIVIWYKKKTTSGEKIVLLDNIRNSQLSEK